MAAKRRLPSEFSLISQYLAPLSKGEKGALGLKDDAAFLKPKAGHEFVVTADAIVEGVHFLKSDPPFRVAQKLLRVNLSDLAAKGAKPRSYFMTCAWPRWIDEAWVKAFCEGLASDQQRFGVILAGGDTVSTSGPLTLSVTMIGEVKSGCMIKRSGAKPGDDLWVTGTIGDAGLGLAVSAGGLSGIEQSHTDFLTERYQVPQPRMAIIPLLQRVAHAAIDLSDGLVADCGHLASNSKFGIALTAGDVPLSPAAVAAIETNKLGLEILLTAGDDYEIAFAAPRSARKQVLEFAKTKKVQVARIGQFSKRTDGVVVIGKTGEMLSISRAGFTHF